MKQADPLADGFLLAESGGQKRHVLSFDKLLRTVAKRRRATRKTSGASLCAAIGPLFDGVGRRTAEREKSCNIGRRVSPAETFSASAATFPEERRAEGRPDSKGRRSREG